MQKHNLRIMFSGAILQLEDFPTKFAQLANPSILEKISARAAFIDMYRSNFT